MSSNLVDAMLLWGCDMTHYNTKRKPLMTVHISTLVVCQIWCP